MKLKLITATVVIIALAGLWGCDNDSSVEQSMPAPPDKSAPATTPTPVNVEVITQDVTEPSEKPVDTSMIDKGELETAPVVEEGVASVLQDADGDGVGDDQDKCQGTPQGISVNADGCEPDGDLDGIADSSDQCADTPQGAKVDNTGCMEKLVLHDVTFQVNSTQLTDEAKQILATIADVLKGRPDIKSLHVEGHTDSIGSDIFNQQLSLARAQSVADYFKSSGVDISITASGKGETTPVADNTTAEGRAQNRRVELRIEK